MTPMTTRIEKAIYRDLLQEWEKPVYFAEFLYDALLRGDTLSRFLAHIYAIQYGIKTPNEVRAQENMNPYDGGDEYLYPLNLGPMSQLGQAQPAGSAQSASDQQKLAAAILNAPTGAESITDEITKILKQNNGASHHGSA